MAPSNADVVRAIETAWDENRLDDLDRYFAPGFENAQSATPGVPAGLAGSKMAHQGVMQSFPDRKVEILDVVEGGDRVFVRNRITGTNQGGFPAFNVPANGNPFDIEAWGVYRLENGLMQLGAIPGPGG